MAQSVTIQANTRAGHAAAVRRQSAIPAVVYGHGMQTLAIQVDNKSFRKLWHQAGMTSIVNLTLDKEELPVLIRDIQMHPMYDEVLHIDFYRVRMDEAIEAKVPLVFVGTAAAVKELGGVLVKNIDEVELEALPVDLPQEITVDIGVLKDFESVIHVKDLHVSDKVKIQHNPDDVIALVQPPRSEQELEQLSEEVKEDVEAVEGVKKEEKPAEGEDGEAAATPEAQGEKKE